MPKLRLRYRRQVKRDLQEIADQVLYEHEDDPDALTQAELKKEVLDRYDRRQKFIRNLDPETRSRIRDLFIKLLEKFIDRLFDSLI